jgi:hypothetical protein
VSLGRSLTGWMPALAPVALLATGCASPVGVSRLGEQAAHRKLNANVLSSGKASVYSTQILERTALSQRYREAPKPWSDALFA